MMWIGTGLWWNLGFYQHFQETYGAVFVWSMYLAIAADGYVRHGRSDQLRTLAARFAAFTEQLNAPPWNAEWYVKEARAHGIDGVVHLVGDSPRGGYFITRALEGAGIPVLEIHAENIDARDWDEQAMTAAVSAFIEERALPAAETRSTR